jgi:transcription termination/antitermination protein NusG
MAEDTEHATPDTAAVATDAPETPAKDTPPTPPAPEPAPALPAEEPPAVADEGEKEVETPEPAPAAAPAAVENKKKWYVVKVQSGREDTIKEAIDRRVKKEGLEEYFGRIVIPVEKYTEVKQDKNNRKVTRTKERKLYPGYLFVEVEYNDRILYLFRETSGVGDFVGSHPAALDRAPTPMTDREVQRMLGPTEKEEEGVSDIPTPPKGMHVGNRVRVVDGIFNGQEGIVKQILDTVGKVQVEVTIFGRPVSVEVEYYQVEEI